MASSTLCKIHVNNSTGVSLNERFTAMSSQPKVTVGGRSRSRSVERSLPRIDHATTRANQRFLAELQRKHKLQAAMKLKRRSMRTVGGGPGGAYGRIKRGSVKALRVGANGKPMRTNSLANIATMNADREVLKRRTTPLRRSNSSGSLSNRLGPRRPLVGGAAQRIARRRLDRQRGGVVEKGGRSLASGGRIVGRSRSRNRSLTRVPENGRSRSRSRNQNTGTDVRGRSRSRSRNPVQTRSLSRNRGRERASAKSSLPIKARLGVRPGTNANVAQNNRRVNKNRRSASLPRGGVQNGRVQKNRNLGSRNAGIKAGVNINRPRSRSAIRNANEPQRSRSRTRRGQVGQQRVQGQVQKRDSNQVQQRGRGQVQQRGPGQAQQGGPRQAQQRGPGQAKQRGPGQDRQRGPGQTRQRGPNQALQRRRGRSQQRRGAANNAQKGSPNPKANNQQRSGRSRSRTGTVGRGGPRNQGKATKGTVNKDALDKELDQYMATTKTVNDMDFLLKN